MASREWQEQLVYMTPRDAAATASAISVNYLQYMAEGIDRLKTGNIPIESDEYMTVVGEIGRKHDEMRADLRMVIDQKAECSPFYKEQLTRALNRELEGTMVAYNPESFVRSYLGVDMDLGRYGIFNKKMGWATEGFWLMFEIKQLEDKLLSYRPRPTSELPEYVLTGIENKASAINAWLVSFNQYYEKDFTSDEMMQGIQSYGRHTYTGGINIEHLRKFVDFITQFFSHES